MREQKGYFTRKSCKFITLTRPLPIWNGYAEVRTQLLLNFEVSQRGASR